MHSIFNNYEKEVEEKTYENDVKIHILKVITIKNSQQNTWYLGILPYWEIGFPIKQEKRKPNRTERHKRTTLIS